MSEFKLSEKIVFNPKGINWVSERNVKEFIRLLKEEFPLESKNKPKFDALDIRFSIDKLSGDLK